MKHAHDSQSGNVLWFILLAVALLGFLTIVISRIGSSVEQSGNIEQTRVRASALLRYGKSVETAVSQLLSQGISENNLDFSAIGASYNNPNCTETSCKIFQMEGGGINYRKPSEILGDANFSENWVISSGNRIGGLGCDDPTDECRDLILLVKGLPDTLCKQINSIMNIQNPAGAPPQQQNIDDATPFTGSYSASGANYILGGTNATNESPQVASKSSGCVTKFSGTSSNYFYDVLLAR